MKKKKLMSIILSALAVFVMGICCVGCSSTPPEENEFDGLKKDVLYVSESKVDSDPTEDERLLYFYMIMSDSGIKMNFSEGKDDYSFENYEACTWDAGVINSNKIIAGVQYIQAGQDVTFTIKQEGDNLKLTAVNAGETLLSDCVIVEKAYVPAPFTGLKKDVLYVSESKVDSDPTEDERLLYFYMIITDNEVKINFSENNNDYSSEDTNSWNGYEIVTNTLVNEVQNIVDNQAHTYVIKKENGKIKCAFSEGSILLDVVLVEV